MSESPFHLIPQSRGERWKLLRKFVDQWYSPLGSADGYPSEVLDTTESRLAIRLPIALRDWYVQSGRRHDIWSRQDSLLPPEEIYIKEGHIVFYTENQSVVDWGIEKAHASLDDPPVFVSSADTEGEWIQENATTSEFCLQMLVSCVKWSPVLACWANGWASEPVINLVKGKYSQLAFPEWYWAGPTRYFGQEDLLIELNSGDGWLWAVSRTHTAFHQFNQSVTAAGMQWESQSDEWPAGGE